MDSGTWIDEELARIAWDAEQRGTRFRVIHRGPDRAVYKLKRPGRVWEQFILDPDGIRPRFRHREKSAASGCFQIVLFLGILSAISLVIAAPSGTNSQFGLDGWATATVGVLGLVVFGGIWIQYRSLTRAREAARAMAWGPDDRQRVRPISPILAILAAIYVVLFVVLGMASLGGGAL